MHCINVIVKKSKKTNACQNSKQEMKKRKDTCITCICYCDSSYTLYIIIFTTIILIVFQFEAVDGGKEDKKKKNEAKGINPCYQ